MLLALRRLLCRFLRVVTELPLGDVRSRAAHLPIFASGFRDKGPGTFNCLSFSGMQCIVKHAMAKRQTLVRTKLCIINLPRGGITPQHLQETGSLLEDEGA